MFGLDRYAHKMTMPSAEKALPGREQVYLPKDQHFVLAESLLPEYPVGTERAIFGMGCFWGVERLFWQQKGMFVTAVGYGGGYTPNPTYEEVCSGQTGHNEWVLVVYWPNEISYTQLLSLFWNNHNPTQVMRQGNDLGTQYRSGIYYCSEEQKDLAVASKQSYQQILAQRGGGQLATEIVEAGPFYFAEDYHQQYLAKNPGGYCNMQSCVKTGLPQWQA